MVCVDAMPTQISDARNGQPEGQPQFSEKIGRELNTISLKIR